MLVRIYKKHEVFRGGSHDDGSAWSSINNELEIVQIPDCDEKTQEEMIRGLENSIVEEMANQDYNYICNIRLLYEGHHDDNASRGDVLAAALLAMDRGD